MEIIVNLKNRIQRIGIFCQKIGREETRNEKKGANPYE
jgi:hypothetical protein